MDGGLLRNNGGTVMPGKTLVTGAAGFIGFHTTKRLLERGEEVVGIDNLNDYYEVQLKRDRLEVLQKHPKFTFHCVSVEDGENVSKVLAEGDFDNVIHLAGQAGVRAPPSDADLYVASNLVGFCNVMEGCRANNVKHLVYASSSSVYGSEAVPPFSAHHNVDHPQSLYAATKRANELLAHSYSYNYQLPTTGLRFFTVYGPWGRPDMAVYKFTKKISEGEPINLYGNGELLRDFTYVDDVVDIILRVVDSPPTNEYNGAISPATSQAPYQIYNVGNSQPVAVKELVRLIEVAMGRKAKVHYEPTPLADMEITHADVQDLEDAFGFRPTTSLREGIVRFIEWFQNYHCRAI